MWQAVEKKRWLHRFGWAKQDSVGPVPDSTELRAYFEYGLVSIRSEKWETICIECVGGPVEEMSKLLEATIKHLKETGWIIGQLTPELSRSYPELLSSAQFAL